MMRRSPFGFFLLVGFGVLIGAALFGDAEAVGTVLAAPLIALGFLFKVFLFMVLFGVAARVFMRAGGEARRQAGRPHPWKAHRDHWRRQDEDTDTRDLRGDRFEEWHRMAHARQEVDDHTPPVEE